MMVAFVAALSTFLRFPEETDAVVAPVAALFASEDGAAPHGPIRDGLSAHFTFCHSGGGSNCVVDGDTFWFADEKYRIADIDTPETHPARCAEEAALGGAATERLQQWLNAGAFSLESAGRDSDRYGRKLRIVTRGGDSVGSLLIGEGLARPWEGRRRPWCTGAS
ncbi:thermonuclease family protein [Sphingopyxis sp. JAI128]|uniref:thermonuclease family protein n=1 Tax=Sphingopyxis sp. JAI128 TaxID=2723066 RepID=UPI00160FD139|nr:thermonuclease family protein [Sphingopyxis sp. JAI128]MBB6425818.1 endonuclease YncB(thermonuclease family) [Sphingopyxis sp. JAI128]